MSSYPSVDWEYLQKVLASAFAVQESHIDSQSLYAAVKVGRLVKSGDLDVNEAMHLIVDRVDRAPRVDNTTEIAMDPFCAALPEIEEHDQSSAPSVAPPKDELPSAEDILKECFPSFQAVAPEVKTGHFRLRDWWTPLLVIEAIALALLLSLMLGRVVWLRTAPPYRPPWHVTSKSYAAPAQPGEARQADPSPSPLVPPKSRSPEPPSGGLVVYQDGKVIFRLKSPQAPGELSAPDSALGSPRKTNVRVLHQVEPDYPEAAKQQHIQGSVVLEAQVGKEGAVQHLTVLSGDSMLATAASDAVLKWRFKPIVQDGRALPFQTRVKVHFVLR
jgi:TonB family protein